MTNQSILNVPPEVWARGATPNEWPEPDLSVLADQRLDPPPLPLEVFGAFWSEWIRDQAEAKGCAPDYVAAGLLGGAGVLLGNARWGSPWDGWAEPPIVWVSAVGNPSSGKSPGLDAMRDLIGSIEADVNKNHKDNLASWDTGKRLAKIKLDVWGDDCKKALKAKRMEPPRPKDTDEPPRPARKRIITNDPTVEKVASSPAGLERSTSTAAPEVIVPSIWSPMAVEPMPLTE